MKGRAGGLWLRWGAVAAMSGLIFFLSSQPDLHLGRLKYLEFPDADKLEHAGAYFIWALLFSSAARTSWPRMRPLPGILLAALAGTLYGASDELHQSFVPGRTSDLLDLSADAAGALLGACLHATILYRHRKRLPHPPPPPEGNAPRSGASGQ